MNTERLKSAALAAFLAVWFLGQTWRGLFIEFTEDDLMNLYLAWVMPLRRLLLGNLTPFTSVYRPVGSALYRLAFLFPGFSPRPFRIVFYAVMLLNIWLIYRVVKLLTESSEIAALCALLGSYHKRLMDLFVNNGTVYDVICFTFFWLTFYYYVAARRKYGTIRGWRLVIFGFLYSLALNSKEMAASMPLLLLGYEAIYHRPSGWTPRALLRWLSGQYAVWISAIITVIAIKAKTAAGGPYEGVTDYVPHFSAQQFFFTSGRFLSQLVFTPEDPRTPAVVLLAFALVWTIAIVARSRVLLLAALIVTVTPLPANFIAARGFYAMYVPLLGWALFAGTILVRLREWTPKLPPLGLFAITGCVLFAIQYNDSYRNFDQRGPEPPLIHILRKSLEPIRPSLPRNASVLFLRDPFRPDQYDPLWIVRLLYRDPTITVDRVKAMPSGSPPVQLDKYTLVLDYCGGYYYEAAPGTPPAPQCSDEKASFP
jgi:hypothetical protein